MPLDYKEALALLLHEVPTFNKSVNESCERLGRALQGRDVTQASEYNARIHGCAQQLSLRVAFIAAEMDPESLRKHGVNAARPYGKFDKARKLLAYQWQPKGLKVKFDGSSHRHVELYYIFDIVPFTLLDNAIKYAPQGTEISILFEELPSKLVIRLESIGPRVAPGELPKLTERGYRGEQAAQSEPRGEGLGLYMAHRICELHGFALSLGSGTGTFQINSIPHAPFTATLEVPLS